MKDFYSMMNKFFYTVNMLTTNEEGDNLSSYGKVNKEGKRSSKNPR